MFPLLPAFNSRKAGYPILDILDIPVQNHPVIAGPFLAQSHKATKNSHAYHEAHEGNKDNTLSQCLYARQAHKNTDSVFPSCLRVFVRDIFPVP